MNTVFQCPICGATFNTEQTFDEHNQRCMDGLLGIIGYEPIIPTNVNDPEDTTRRMPHKWRDS